MKLVGLIKMCLNNGLKEGDALPPLLSQFSSEYVIWRVQVNPEGLKFNGTHQVTVCADYVNILGGSVHYYVKKNTESLVVASVVASGVDDLSAATLFLVFLASSSVRPPILQWHNVVSSLLPNNTLVEREVNSETTKCMFMSRDQNSRQVSRVFSGGRG